MSGTVNLQQRMQQLKKLQADLPGVLKQATRDATLRAVKAAQEATPPKEGTGRGSYIGDDTISGELKKHWLTDSTLEPEEIAGGFQTVLANDMEYASYVDQGHRMDRHFVPGLYINPGSGLLEYDPSADVGLVVGTKTKYVKGEFMVDKAKEAFHQAALELLDQKIGGLLK